MRSRVFSTIVGAVSLLLMSCPSAGEASISGLFNPGKAQKAKMEKALSGYVGGPLSNYIIEHGEPSDAVELSDTSKSFRWHLTAQGTGAVVPMYGMWAVMPPSQLTCDVTLRASKPTDAEDKPRFWTIESWTWQGNC